MNDFGPKPGDEDDDRDADWGAARDEHEQKIIDDYIKELLRARGAKTGGYNAKQARSRKKDIFDAAALMRAVNPRLKSNSAVGRELEKIDKKKFGSAKTIRKILGDHDPK